MASTANGDNAAQQAREDRETRHANIAKFGQRQLDNAPEYSGSDFGDIRGTYHSETPFRGSEDEGYSDQRSNQAEQRHALQVKGVGEGLKGYPDKPDPEHTIDEPYLKVNTPNEYPQSSWGHIGRRPYGGAK